MGINIEGRRYSALADVAAASGQTERVLMAVCRKLPGSGFSTTSNSLRPGVLTFVDLRALGRFESWLSLVPGDFVERLTAVERLDSICGAMTPLCETEAAAEREKFHSNPYPTLDYVRGDPSPARQRDSLGRLVW